MRSLLLSLFFLLPALAVQARQEQQATEQKRLVYFTDKSHTPYTLAQPLAYLSQRAVERRERQRIPLTTRDLPVDPAYVAGLKQQGVQVWYTSRWFNAAVVQCSVEQLTQLQELPYVKGSFTLNRKAGQGQPQERQQAKLQQSITEPAPEVAEAYGKAFHQANMLGTVELHQDGYRGEGMTVAVFDAGFPGADTIPAFSHLYQNGQLQGTFDFVQKSPEVYTANAHGTAVLSTMAAYAPGTMIGTAYKANYLLLRTEDAGTEHPIEEINWLLAAEYADSAGADVINSSLGYTSFDAPSVSYTYADLDGNTTLVSKAADIAAAVGMLVVVSAGNEGNDSWHYISAPADADSVLTVGAVDSLGNKASFSSFGPTADGRIKPDVVAMGVQAAVLNPQGKVRQGSGTSFAGPIMAGFATCLWQANPSKRNYQLILLLRQMGSQAASPDEGLGYGIPNYSRLVTALPELPELPGAQAASITNPVTLEEISLTLGLEWALQPVVVHIFDATGKLVYQEAIPQPKSRQALRLQGRQLQRGLYICRVYSASHSATLRFVRL